MTQINANCQAELKSAAVHQSSNNSIPYSLVWSNHTTGYGLGFIKAILAETCDDMYRHITRDYAEKKGIDSKWTRPVKGERNPITSTIIDEHINGAKFYGSEYSVNKWTRMIVADVDEGGISTLIETVNALAAHNLCAFAEYQPSDKHDGGRVFIPFPQWMPVAQAMSAFDAFVSANNLPLKRDTTTRAALPFGVSTWARNGYGRATLILPDTTYTYKTADELNSILDVWADLFTLNNAGELLAYAPALVAATPRPAPPRPAPATVATDGTGYERDQVIAYAAQHFTTYDAADAIGLMQSKRNRNSWHCVVCGKHPNGDKSPSVFVGDHTIIFKSANCRYHQHPNGKKGYTAFDLIQHVMFGGDYNQAIDYFREKFNLPRPVRRQRSDYAPDPKPYWIEPASIQGKKYSEVVTIRNTCRARAESERMSESERAVLDYLIQYSRRDSATVCCTWDRIAEKIDYSKRQVQRAIEKLEAGGYLRKHADSTKRGREKPAVVELLQQKMDMNFTFINNYAGAEVIKSKKDVHAIYNNMKEGKLSNSELLPDEPMKEDGHATSADESVQADDSLPSCWLDDLDADVPPAEFVETELAELYAPPQDVTADVDLADLAFAYLESTHGCGERRTIRTFALWLDEMAVSYDDLSTDYAAGREKYNKLHSDLYQHVVTVSRLDDDELIKRAQGKRKTNRRHEAERDVIEQKSTRKTLHTIKVEKINAEIAKRGLELPIDPAILAPLPVQTGQTRFDIQMSTPRFSMAR